MENTRNLTCIICPLGCALTVEFDSDGNVSKVSGNTCPRGKQYAIDECTNPVRTITSTVRCEDGSVIPVKTNKSVPKGKVFEVCVAEDQVEEMQSRYLVGNIRKDEDEKIWVRVIDDKQPEGIVQEVMPTLEDVYLYTFEDAAVREEGAQ